MENQPRDESRAATVREGGNDSWNEAAEFNDDPSRLPTARASGSSGDATGERSNPSGGFQSTVGQQQTRSPHGSDFSSSAAPIGQGSNMPVGDEPDSFQEWDARQPAPGPDTNSMGMMPGRWSMGGLLAAGVASALAMFWWRRRQTRQTRYARVQQLLMGAGLSAGSDLPRMIGQATAKSGSPWLPFVLLPIALWLRERGKTGRQASEQLLEPLELERRSQRLARQGGDALEAYTRRWIRQIDPNASRGPGWTPFIFTGTAIGGAYLAYQRGWLRLPSSMMSGMSGQSPSRSTLVREVMSSQVETVSPETTVADVARRMRDLDVGSLPVTEDRRLIGMVTDRDLAIRAAAAGRDPASTPVRDVMSPEVTWVFDHEPADMAASVMRRRQIRRLPVLDGSDRLVGIVSLADLATDLSDDRLKGETLEDISEPTGRKR